MSGITCYETYNCGHDCDGWGGSCPGHQACLIFRGSSETYELQLEDGVSVGFTRQTMAALLALAKRVADSHACAAGYVPKGYELIKTEEAERLRELAWRYEELQK